MTKKRYQELTEEIIFSAEKTMQQEGELADPEALRVWEQVKARLRKGQPAFAI